MTSSRSMGGLIQRVAGLALFLDLICQVAALFWASENSADQNVPVEPHQMPGHALPFQLV